MDRTRPSAARRSAVLTLPALALAVLAAGCSPVGVAVGAGATAGTIAMEERGFRQGVADRATKASIVKRLLDAGFEIFRAVNVEVYEGRVLLTGIVSDPEHRTRAAALTWEVDGVHEVINEVVVGDTSFADSARDARIAAEIRAAITLDRDVSAINYAIEVFGGRVYLFGIAQNEAELQRVVAHARKVDSVRRVIADHVMMKDDPRRDELRSRSG